MTISRGPACVLGSVVQQQRAAGGRQRQQYNYGIAVANAAPAVSSHTAASSLPRPAAPAWAALNDYSDRVNKATLCFEMQQKEYIESLSPPSLSQRTTDRTAGAKTHVVTGPERHAKLRKALKSLGLTYSDDQREFTNRMIAACAKLIYKTDLEAHIADVLTELKIDELHQELMAIMPRRYGKTMMVAAFVVALLVSIEGIEIGIFSTGRRASQKILEQIYWFLLRHGGMNIIKHNVETIWIQGPCGPSDIRKVSSYPSNVRISSTSSSSFVCAEKRAWRG